MATTGLGSWAWPESGSKIRHTVVLTVHGEDEFGNTLGDLTDEAVFTSSFPGDLVDGNRITFTHASPYTITATVDDVSASVTVEVTPATSITGEAGPETLSFTGGALPIGWMVAAAVALLTGVAAFAASRVRSNGSGPSPRER